MAAVIGRHLRSAQTPSATQVRKDVRLIWGKVLKPVTTVYHREVNATRQILSLEVALVLLGDIGARSLVLD
jgi:hypothetical protein